MSGIFTSYPMVCAQLTTGIFSLQTLQTHARYVPIAGTSKMFHPIAPLTYSQSTENSLKDFFVVVRLAPESHRHGEVGMDLAILEILGHQRDEDIDLLLLPTQSSCE